MDTNQLQAFEQIVRQGNFSKAARMLVISQPTITARIQALERAVGGALFVRGGSRLELTELGASFLPYARQALTVLATGIENAQMTSRGARGRVTIGTLPSLTTGFFASALARLRTAHPHVGIFVHTGHAMQVAEMLHDGFVKLGLINWPFFSSDLTPILHFQEPLIVVAHAHHPLARKGECAVAELEQESNPFLHVDWTMEVRFWQSRLLAEKGAAIEVPIHTAYDLVSRGIGAALLTRTLVASDLASGRLVEITVEGLPPFFRESALVRLTREEKLPAAVQEFVGMLREEGRAFCQPAQAFRDHKS
ncbi:MAG: LysR family transcriptional regulator [Chloroflexota bacterium]|nr:LysR family transcriptional regulator [Chloroflexota bacterium]